MRTHTDTDTAGLPVLGVESLDGRLVQYSWPIGQDRLRLLLCGLAPPGLGSVVGLDGDSPRLVLSEPAHADWAGTHSGPLIAAAVRIWLDTFRDCEG
ncbi:hypothetical protein [Glycomyces xiaoerkulensis]|uniref:hypothetical protein n=1 Tax=Glycomyces xiaoerkulensis TaxID=2038139 RepID=UPI000C25A33A|nr:hypothetical protein [Glycomyces xiaoerkulensis]